MAGTKEGGIKAAATNKAKYGPEFYSRIGGRGGKNGRTGGFAQPVNCEENHYGYDANHHVKRQCAGTKGGTISRRTKRSV